MGGNDVIETRVKELLEAVRKNTLSKKTLGAIDLYLLERIEGFLHYRQLFLIKADLEMRKPVTDKLDVLEEKGFSFGIADDQNRTITERIRSAFAEDSLEHISKMRMQIVPFLLEEKEEQQEKDEKKVNV